MRNRYRHDILGELRGRHLPAVLPHLLRVIALSLLLLASVTKDEGLIMAAGFAFVGLCCWRDEK